MRHDLVACFPSYRRSPDVALDMDLASVSCVLGRFALCTYSYQLAALHCSELQFGEIKIETAKV